jgi:hypothetical protein
MPNGRILRVRLDLTYTMSSTVSVEDASAYGTTAGFRGHAHPGDGALGRRRCGVQPDPQLGDRSRLIAQRQHAHHRQRRSENGHEVILS